MRNLFAAVILCALVFSAAAFAQAGLPYVYQFPKPSAEWGSAVAFGNLSPGFFQVMYENSKTGIVRIATYGIVGASMDKLRDPQLMMVFAFDQKSGAVSKFHSGKFLVSERE